MTAAEIITRTAPEGVTERFDPAACLDERVRNEARAEGAEGPGRYIEVQGLDERLLIELGTDVVHVGRGLKAELHLDEASVSRRHAIIVPGEGGARILDDRSSNGTFVNGRRIQQQDLRDGDVIAVGRVTLRYVEV
ncbi:MAG TPA: FHA domain-containing protein [Solirubrobacteraceae bacterium]|jgi:hypothetical protein|nr:FHA domain-containing protein [Solirubrobacteraceae bacterium]